VTWIFTSGTINMRPSWALITSYDVTCQSFVNIMRNCRNGKFVKALRIGCRDAKIDLQIITYQVKIENDDVLVQLPVIEEVDAILATSGMRVHKSDCIDLAEDAIKVKPNKQSSMVLMAKAKKEAGRVKHIIHYNWRRTVPNKLNSIHHVLSATSI